jgi:hypothetical protein
MKFPSDDEITIALLWLESNEGEGEEGKACKAVAMWLENHSRNKNLRKFAKEHGVTTAKVREAIRTARMLSC